MTSMTPTFSAAKDSLNFRTLRSSGRGQGLSMTTQIPDQRLITLRLAKCEPRNQLGGQLGVNCALRLTINSLVGGGQDA